MTFKISISPDGTYLQVKVLSAITGEMGKDLAESAIKDARQKNIQKYLVDVRGAPNIASTAEQYLLGYDDMAQLGLDRGSRIAILADPDDTSHNFIETVFLNAGYFCRIFSDETTAIKWLAD